MTKKQAKKEAAHIAYYMIQSYLDVGQPYYDCIEGRYNNHRRGQEGIESGECPDCDNICEQLRVYIAEMDRRAQ